MGRGGDARRRRSRASSARTTAPGSRRPRRDVDHRADEDAHHVVEERVALDDDGDDARIALRARPRRATASGRCLRARRPTSGRPRSRAFREPPAPRARSAPRSTSARARRACARAGREPGRPAHDNDSACRARRTAERNRGGTARAARTATSSGRCWLRPRTQPRGRNVARRVERGELTFGVDARVGAARASQGATRAGRGPRRRPRSVSSTVRDAFLRRPSRGTRCRRTRPRAARPCTSASTSLSLLCLRR